MVARTLATRRSASSRDRMRAAVCRCFCRCSRPRMVALLHPEDLAIDLVGDADAAALGDVRPHIPWPAWSGRRRRPCRCRRAAPPPSDGNIRSRVCSRNIVSKSCAVLRAFSSAAPANASSAIWPTFDDATVPGRPRLSRRHRERVPGERPSHHLDLGLQGAGRLDRLQDRDQVARADAERVEAVDELAQRHALADVGELVAGARRRP